MKLMITTVDYINEKGKTIKPAENDILLALYNDGNNELNMGAAEKILNKPLQVEFIREETEDELWYRLGLIIGKEKLNEAVFYTDNEKYKELSKTLRSQGIKTTNMNTQPRIKTGNAVSAKQRPETEPVTLEVTPKKRGRKPKVKTEISA